MLIVNAADPLAAELFVEGRAARKAGDGVRTWVISWAVGRQARYVRRVQTSRRVAAESPDRPYLVGVRPGRATRRWNGPGDSCHGDVVDASSAREEQRRVREAIDRDTRSGLTVHSHRRGRVAGALAVGLLAADAVALFAVFGFLLNVDWLAPDVADLVTAVALALFGTGVQAELATVLGDRLRARRCSAAVGTDEAAGEEEPSPGWVLGLLATALLVMGSLAATAIFARVAAEGVLADAEAIAVPLALTLAGAAVTAPWVVAAHRAFDGSWATRREAGLSGVIVRHSAYVDAGRRSIESDSAAADRWAGRAERWSQRQVTRAGRPYQRAHSAILLARALRLTVVVESDVMTASRWLPQTALPMRVAPDLRAIERLMERSARLTLEVHHRVCSVVSKEREELDLAG